MILGSHDADFAPNMTVLADGERRVGLIVFTECVGQPLREVPGVEIFDLESHVGAFDVPLPRIRIISIEEFDPEQFL